MKVNKRVVMFKRDQNQKLLRILERIEHDQPILIHDKLNIIWDKDQEGKKKSFNQYSVKTDLMRLKTERNAGNKRQMIKYTRMQALIESRKVHFSAG